MDRTVLATLSLTYTHHPMGWAAATPRKDSQMEQHSFTESERLDIGREIYDGLGIDAGGFHDHLRLRSGLPFQRFGDLLRGRHAASAVRRFNRLGRRFAEREVALAMDASLRHVEGQYGRFLVYHVNRPSFPAFGSFP